jgi:fucose permease
MVALALVPDWTLFLGAAIPLGVGMGGIDGGMNGLVLDLYPAGRGRALNLLHLCFSLGALASPLVVGRVVDAGASWQSVIFASAVAAIPIAILFAVVRLPSGRHEHAPGSSAIRTGLALPLVLLAVAIALYVGAELGVSNWLVRYLQAASLTLATSALALFWACLALGRLVSARLGDRFDHAWFAATSAMASAVALVAAVAVPSLDASILLFGVVGFAFGPVYPLIMAVAGDRYPARSAAVSGFLAGIAITGAIIYPPLMGFVSVGAGLGVAMLGAAALVFACGALLAVVARRPAAVPEVVGA